MLIPLYALIYVFAGGLQLCTLIQSEACRTSIRQGGPQQIVPVS